MKRINNKLVNEYINGDDIEDYTLEELQDNKLFMEKVIETTNDYKMYFHCSDRVKSNAGFVRFLIKKFSNNLDFLCEVANFYFEKPKYDPDSIEIAIIIRSLLKSKDDDRYYKYEMMRDLMYITLRLQVESFKLLEEDEECKCDMGLGFLYIIDEYKNNELVTYFYAKKMLEELFIDDYYAIDRILHKQFSTALEVEEKGVYNTLINIINIYDSMLASFVCVHKDLLKKVIKKMYAALKRWDKYVDLHESQQFDKIYEQVNEYMENVDYRSVLSERELLSYVGVQLGIEEKLVQYQLLDQVDIDIVKEEEKSCISTINGSFIDRLNYCNVKKIVKDILFSNENVEEKEEEKENNIVYLKDFKKRKCKQN